MSQQELEWKIESTSPFEFVNSISETKEYIFAEETQSGYNPYVINRALSNQPDCLFFANEMNRYSSIPPKAQYEFYLYSIDKKRRRGKWEKAVKDEDLELIMEVYEYNRAKAEQVIAIFTEDQINELRNRYGGRTTKRSSRK
jgi:hypothetical protein